VKKPLNRTVLFSFSFVTGVVMITLSVLKTQAVAFSCQECHWLHFFFKSLDISGYHGLHTSLFGSMFVNVLGI